MTFLKTAINLSICAVVTVSAGAIRIVVGVGAFTKTPLSRNATSTLFEIGDVNSIAIKSPAPRTSLTPGIKAISAINCFSCRLTAMWHHQTCTSSTWTMLALMVRHLIGRAARRYNSIASHGHACQSDVGLPAPKPRHRPHVGARTVAFRLPQGATPREAHQPERRLPAPPDPRPEPWRRHRWHLR
jgi:hypothetical protein